MDGKWIRREKNPFPIRSLIGYYLIFSVVLLVIKTSNLITDLSYISEQISTFLSIDDGKLDDTETG